MRIVYTLIILLLAIGCNTNDSSKATPETASKKNMQKASVNDTLRIDTSVDFVTGRFNFKSHEDFIKVEPVYTNKEVYLHKKTYEAFKAMADSAESAGINLIIVSGTRNFDYQKSIWDRKWNASDSTTALGKALGILEFSSMPMTSRHHWGTDIDLIKLNNHYFEAGQGKKEYEWLQEHANQFGFYQPYTNKSTTGRTGYSEEKWHWSYLPLAKQFLAYYNTHVTNKDIQGFKGSEQAKKIDMVKNYVNGISDKLKKASDL